MFTGSLVALVTPMHEDGQIDFDCLYQLIDWHINNGTNAIVSVGTTGESATLNLQEHLSVLKATIRHANKRIPVIAGTGGNSTAEAIELAKLAKQAGANATLSVVPYYNKPTQEGIYQHFCKIAECVDIPMILYNVPTRTVADLSNEMVLKLAEIPNIIGLKDATGNIGRACELIMRAPENFKLYSGDDISALAFLLCGGDGVISVTANVAPKLFQQMCTEALQHNILTARKLNNQLQSLHRSLFIEPNPIPVKWVLHQMGKIKSGIRLPLTPLSASYVSSLKLAMQYANIV